MMYGYGTDMTWWMVVYSILWAVLVGLAITSIIVWLRRGTATTPTAGTSPDVHRVLANRLARGEIDDEEFRRLTQILRSSA